MVLPPELLQRYRATYGTYSNTVSRFEQQTLCRFMEGGYFTRHLSRMRNTYKARMEHLARSLTETFGPQRILLNGRHTGLHLLLTLPDGPGEEEMVRRAEAHGILLRGLSTYFMQSHAACPANTVILGYAALQDQDIEPLTALLRDIWLP
jgi:GntR family transcriptional regulator/MocR family aminotransferase